MGCIILFSFFKKEEEKQIVKAIKKDKMNDTTFFSQESTHTHKHSTWTPRFTDLMVWVLKFTHPAWFPHSLRTLEISGRLMWVGNYYPSPSWPEPTLSISHFHLHHPFLTISSWPVLSLSHCIYVWVFPTSKAQFKQ